MIKRLKGFTLVELMIVIAIVAILAALVIPYFQDRTTHDVGRDVAIGGNTPQTAMFVSESGKYRIETEASGSAYATEFDDASGHHCVMVVYGGSVALSCQGH